MNLLSDQVIAFRLSVLESITFDFVSTHDSGTGRTSRESYIPSIYVNSIYVNKAAVVGHWRRRTRLEVRVTSSSVFDVELPLPPLR